MSPARRLWGFWSARPTLSAAVIYAVLTVLTVFVLRRLAHSHDVAAPQELEEAVPS